MYGYRLDDLVIYGNWLFQLNSYGHFLVKADQLWLLTG